MSKELKPCPFCGSEAEVVTCGSFCGFEEVFVRCSNGLCQARIDAPQKRTDVESVAIMQWNTRAERTCHIVPASRKYVLSDGTEAFEDGCSECGEYVAEYDNFCPNCGARVVGGDAE